MKKSLIKILGVCSVLLLFTANTAVAQTDNDYRSFYKFVAPVPETSIVVPTVVETRILSDIFSKSGNVAVYEVGSGTFIQTSSKQADRKIIPPTVTIARNAGQTLGSLQDGDDNTFYTIEAFPDGIKRGETWISSITLRWNSPVSASKLIVALDDKSPKPEKIMISSATGIVVPWTDYTDSIIEFGRTVESQRFVVQLEHTEDIKIAEVSVPYKTDPYNKLYFLAQPNERYQIYTELIEGKRPQSVGQFRLSGPPPRQLGAVTFVANPLYDNSDFDNDGVIAKNDNCTQYANAEQIDKNSNGTGDACEDFDQDGLPTAIDNCPTRSNKSQRDTDGDGIGDECDDKESRLTEQYEWVPLAGIGIAGGVLVLLFALVGMRPREQEHLVSDEEDEGQSE